MFWIGDVFKLRQRTSERKHRRYIFSRKCWVVREYFIYGIATGECTKYLRNHNARTAHDWLAVAYGRIDFYSVVMDYHDDSFAVA